MNACPHGSTTNDLPCQICMLERLEDDTPTYQHASDWTVTLKMDGAATDPHIREAVRRAISDAVVRRHVEAAIDDAGAAWDRGQYLRFYWHMARVVWRARKLRP